MELYKIGGLLLDISIGLLILGAIIRFCLAFKYFKRNGTRTLTGAQRATLGKFSRPSPSSASPSLWPRSFFF